MAQDYDNIGKSLWTAHADDLSRFVLGEDDVEVLADLGTEQQTVIARQTDITKRIRVSGHEAILHVELQLRDSTRTPKELMQESKTYQRQLERMRREATIENTLELLVDQFHPEAVRALTPILQNIEDLQRLKELHLAAARVPNIETFAQMLHE